jgi:hypothetical protein
MSRSLKRRASGKCGGKRVDVRPNWKEQSAEREPNRRARAMIFEIAGLTISGINLGLNLRKAYKDWNSWDESDVEVDRDWLRVVLKKGEIKGSPQDFAWMRMKRLPTFELEGSHSAVFAFNKEKKVKYRIVREGRLGDREILVRRV